MADGTKESKGMMKSNGHQCSQFPKRLLDPFRYRKAKSLSCGGASTCSQSSKIPQKKCHHLIRNSERYRSPVAASDSGTNANYMGAGHAFALRRRWRKSPTVPQTA
jgi:hypothetical protein